jgi:hypothetical protein
MSQQTLNSSLSVRSAKEFFETVSKSANSSIEQSVNDSLDTSSGTVREKIAHYTALHEKHNGQNLNESDGDVSAKVRAYELRLKGVAPGKKETPSSSRDGAENAQRRAGARTPHTGASTAPVRQAPPPTTATGTRTTAITTTPGSMAISPDLSPTGDPPKPTPSKRRDLVRLSGD